MKIKMFIVTSIVICFFPLMGFSQTTSDYLILQDISSYKLDQPEKMLPGRPPTGGPETYDNPGVVGAADHFSLDHTDKTYKVMYIGGNGLPSPSVQVTKHSGSDSDKWLLHELDTDFRNYYGIPGMEYTARQINGQTVFVAAVGGREYRWLSGNKVVVIKYRGSLTQQPDPLEVVNAYLTKHPSTLPTMTLTQMRSVDSKTQWIKDEMDRRLWLCDKWFYQLQLQKIQQTQVLQESVKSIYIFLDYREKYYGVKAADEKNLLASYLSTNNGTGIKTKLDEYKKWWAANKANEITLP